MNSHQSSKEIFRFLDLPPELRNLVYKFTQETYNISKYVLTTTEQLYHPESSNDYVIRTLITRKLCPINQQVKGEVKALLLPSTTFIFEAFDPYIYDWITPDVNFPPSIVSKIGHAVFKINALCYAGRTDRRHVCTTECFAALEVQENGLYAQDMVWHLPNLQTCELEVNILCLDGDTEAYPQIMHAPEVLQNIESLTEIQKLTRVKVYKVYHNKQGLVAAEELWACWSVQYPVWHSPSAGEVAEGKVKVSG